jgi:hypothetical protein
MNHRAVSAAATALAVGTLAVTAVPARAGGGRHGCGLRPGLTIAAQVTGSGTAYCVAASASKVTVKADLLQNGVIVAHGSKYAKAVPPNDTASATWPCTVGDTCQSVATWGGKTAHGGVETATTC